MVTYHAHNRMYYLGKPIGRTYVSAKATSKAAAEKTARKDAASWNRKKIKQGYTTKFVKVKRVGAKRRSGGNRRSGSSNYFANISRYI